MRLKYLAWLFVPAMALAISACDNAGDPGAAGGGAADSTPGAAGGGSAGGPDGAAGGGAAGGGGAGQ